MEVERKFTVARTPALDEAPSQPIEQGYLADGPEGEVRLRRKGDERLLTVKRGSGRSRSEEEIELSAAQFKALWPLTDGRRLSKRRYLLAHGDREIELDVYEGDLEGLVVAEVEFGDEDEARAFEPPVWSPTRSPATPPSERVPGRGRGPELTASAAPRTPQLLPGRPVEGRVRRALLLIAVLVGVLACAQSAFAVRAGHNGPTRALEGAFKIALLERAGSDDGCYLKPAPLAAAFRAGGFKAGVARGLKAVRRSGVVYVIKRGARCDHLVLALRAKGQLWVLNSTEGTVHVQGRARQRSDYLRGSRGPLRAIKLATKTLRLTRVDETQRGEVICPGKTFPLGGGMTSAPPVDASGEGAYPHSYERLGVQRGWHVNPVLIDPTVLTNPHPTDTVARRVTLQVVCGKGLVPASAPHKNIFLRPGETKTATARCPKGQFLVSGGFQRSNFKTPGGNYVTESRAIGTNAWRVTGHAFGDFGGELTTIAYCDRSKRPLLTEVSASVPLPAGQSATATTPPCPRGRRMTLGGFSANGSQDTFYAGGSFNANGTWSATSFGYFGPAPSLTAFGYCLRPGR